MAELRVTAQGNIFLPLVGGHMAKGTVREQKKISKLSAISYKPYAVKGQALLSCTVSRYIEPESQRSEVIFFHGVELGLSTSKALPFYCITEELPGNPRAGVKWRRF